MLGEYPKTQWLTDAYDYEPPRRGQVRKGVILKREAHGITIDIGLKRDGFVPQTDVDRLEEETISALKPGQEVVTRIVQPGEVDDTHVLSLYQAQQVKDWVRAKELGESGEIVPGEVTGYNQGGLLVKFGSLQAFVPASHILLRNKRRLSPAQHQATLEQYVGQKLSLKIIEVDQDRRRLIVSERLAQEQLQQQNMERLLAELVEGEVRQGIVRQLRNFGAFVDLGGATGLIHNSELAWRRVRHPGEIVQVGDEIEVYVLRLDHERKRISLSLKRQQPDPWALVQATHTVDQLVMGTVTNVVDFGAFVALDTGLEGLAHVSELADPPPQKPRTIVQPGDELVLRILNIDPFRRRLRLSLKRVSTQEREEWLAQRER